MARLRWPLLLGLLAPFAPAPAWTAARKQPLVATRPAQRRQRPEHFDRRARRHGGGASGGVPAGGRGAVFASPSPEAVWVRHVSRSSGKNVAGFPLIACPGKPSRLAFVGPGPVAIAPARRSVVRRALGQDQVDVQSTAPESADSAEPGDLDPYDTPRGGRGGDYDSFDDPPPETGRNPEAVAEDFASGLLGLPLAVIGTFVAFLLLVAVRYNTLAPPAVTLREAFTSLVSIEDDYYWGGSSTGVRQRLTKWFQEAQPDRRLSYELEGLPDPVRSKASESGKSAIEYLASVVEYSGWSTGLNMPMETGRMADRMASKTSSLGRSEMDEFATKGITAGRKALAETLRLIEEAKQPADADGDEEE